jgi:integrase
MHMRWEHVREGWWKMPGAPAEGWPGTKNAQSHDVWLGAPAVQALLADLTPAAVGYVLAGERSGPPSHLTAVMRAVCARLSAERATPHDLRRTFCSTVTGLRFGRDAMHRLTNHREGGIGDVYDRHKYAEENKGIWEAVAAHFCSLLHSV